MVLVWKNTNEQLQKRVSTHTGTVRIREVLHHPLHLRLLQPTVSSLSRYFSELPLVGIRCRYSLQSSDANAIFFIFVRVFRRFCYFFSTRYYFFSKLKQILLMPCLYNVCYPIDVFSEARSVLFNEKKRKMLVGLRPCSAYSFPHVLQVVVRRGGSLPLTKNPHIYCFRPQISAKSSTRESLCPITKSYIRHCRCPVPGSPAIRTVIILGGMQFSSYFYFSSNFNRIILTPCHCVYLCVYTAVGNAQY